jgi:small subunit ribosomal protein S6e
MPVLIIADPEKGTNEKVELEDARMAPLVGRRIGEVIDGTVANLAGYRIQLTGGTDKDGIPMRPDVHGGVKARVVLSGGVGFKPRNKGERKRVVVRGNTVTTETTFLNFKIVEKPKGQKKRKAEPKPEEPAEEAQESQE